MLDYFNHTFGMKISRFCHYVYIIVMVIITLHFLICKPLVNKWF